MTYAPTLQFLGRGVTSQSGAHSRGAGRGEGVRPRPLACSRPAPSAACGGAAPRWAAATVAARRRVAGRRRCPAGLGLGLLGGGGSGGGLGPGAAAAAVSGAWSRVLRWQQRRRRRGRAWAARGRRHGCHGALRGVSVFPGARLLTIGDANGEIQRHAEQRALRLSALPARTRQASPSTAVSGRSGAGLRAGAAREAGRGGETLWPGGTR